MTRPWTRVIESCPGRSRASACLPRTSTTSGRIRRSWSSRKGEQASTSSGWGSRLPGGRHFRMLVMKTSARESPMPRSSWSSSLPAAPTKGSPCRSSFWPGASPTIRIRASAGPTPGTACVREAPSGQRRQSCTALLKLGRSANVTKVGESINPQVGPGTFSSAGHPGRRGRIHEAGRGRDLRGSRLRLRHRRAEDRRGPGRSRCSCRL